MEHTKGMINVLLKKSYAFSDNRYSQQLHAIANPSEEDVALPSSSITIRLLSQYNQILVEIIAYFGWLNAFHFVIPLREILHDKSCLFHLCHEL